MTRTSRSRMVFALCAALLATGCAIRVADLTLISTKNIDLSDAKIDVRKGVRATGEDCGYFFTLPNLENAIDDALQRGHGNIMVDQVTYSRPVPFGACIEVEGTVINTYGSD